MANYNLSLPAETIDELLLWLDDKQGIIIKQTDLLSGTGQSTTATMTQKAITDALGTKADASNVYTKTQTDTLLNAKADKSTTYTKTETDNLLGGKVDKEAGKGLSSNDYTDAEKAKLGALPTAAELSADLAAKQDKDTDAVAGNVAVMDASGNSVDGGVALTDLATKADVEAVEQQVAQIAGEAGLAEAVIDTDNAGTEQECTFRKSGGDGGAYYRKIKGKTIVVDDQLASNDADAVETMGVNQWDEEWEDGNFDAGGNPAAAAGYIRSKNFISVIPGSTYCSHRPSGYSSGRILYYTKDKSYVDYFDFEVDRLLTMPSDVCFIKFYVAGTTYNHDICINLSNPAINGQYFPYWKRTLQLGITTRKDTDGNVPFADGMKGAGTAADWADKVGGEKRIERRVISGGFVGNAGATDGVVLNLPADNTLMSNAKTVSSIIGLSGLYDGSFTKPLDLPIYTNGRLFAVIAYGYYGVTDGMAPGQAADAFNNYIAEHPFTIDLPLATPVPFTWAEPLNLGVKVDENGTERAVAPEGATAPSAPFVADTTYTMSVARMVEILKNL